MKKTVLTIATATISVFATAQQIVAPTFKFIGVSENNSVVEILFYDQFRVAHTVDGDDMLNISSELPFQIARIDYSKIDEETNENLFIYESWRKNKNGGQLFSEYRCAHGDEGKVCWNESKYSVLNPRDSYSGLLMKKVEIYMESVNFEYKGEKEMVKPRFGDDIDCGIKVVSTTLNVSGEPYRIFLDENFKGRLYKIDEFGNIIL